MLKKLAVLTVMIATLGLGASQLVAFTECSMEQYECCPTTNQGGNLTFCASTWSQITCTYDNGTRVTMAGND